jgi:hypothetical protein
MKTRMMAALAVGLVLGCAKSDETPPPTTEPATMSAAPVPGSPEAKIADAASAAPKSISDHATIMDWPATEGGQPFQLRAAPTAGRASPARRRPSRRGGPFATAVTPDNQWVESGPHVMIIVPDPTELEGYSTDPKSGLPWVMWSGTPWAHIMAPVSDGM